MGSRWGACAIAIGCGCGRLDFALVGLDGSGAETSPIAWVKPFVANGHNASGTTDSFTASAANVGDAIVIQLYCTTNTSASGVSITAPGWSFTMLGQTGSVANTDWIASVGAIAPDTASATFSVAWTAGSPCNFLDELGDEFSSAAGALTFGAHVEAVGATGSCTAAVTTTTNAAAVWAACSGKVTAVGAGYTKGADDGNDDWSEYRITSDPAGTQEQIRLISAATSWALSVVTIEPR